MMEIQIPRIKTIEYKDSWGNSQSAEVGKYGVEDILEHKACGEGDKWHYDIIKNGKLNMRIFDIITIEYFA